MADIPMAIVLARKYGPEKSIATGFGVYGNFLTVKEAKEFAKILIVENGFNDIRVFELVEVEAHDAEE